MRQSRAWIKRSIVNATLIVAAALAAVALVIAGTIPSLTGTIAVNGLTKPVAIVRDSNAVPHITGASVEDIYRGLGFAHAQDRLWQMEMLRRAGQGRLSEIFGERTLDADIFLRTLDLSGHAERSLTALPADARRLLEAYAAGVNAFIQRRTGLLESRLPPEFLLLGHDPEVWRPSDSVTIAKIMALNLSTNIAAEIQRLTLAAQGLSPAEMADVMPLNISERPPPLPELTQLYPLRRLPAAAPSEQRAAIDELFGAGASNSWVLAGSRAVSGKPLLANDPHLRLSAPSIWYLAHLALEAPAGPANVVGATLPGTPVVVLGRGDTLAWGFTNTEADVQDIFVERINPSNPEEYLTPDGWRRLDITIMEIRVADGPTRYVERRRTRHGPVLPASFRNLGQILAPGYVAALQWTALSDDDTTVAAGLMDLNIRSVAAYLERAARLYVVPMQSMVVTDTEGRIAMIAPGRLPIRHPENRIAGRAPVPGWDATYDWQGFVPTTELPRVVDPAQGAIGTANARIVGDDYPHLITYDWEADYRARRVEEIVTSRSGHDMRTMQAAQLDVFSPAFAELAPLMIETARPAVVANQDVLDKLSRWDATMRADIAEPLIFMAWLRETVRAVFADELGPAFPLFFSPRANAMIRIFKGEATSRDWCDDITTGVKETCGELLAKSLRQALLDLEIEFGADRQQWSWGRAHVALGENQVFGELPLVGRYFNVGGPSPGGPYTLNRGVTEFGREMPFANRHASTLRVIYDFADLDGSLFMQPTGQSGNPFSRYYRTFATRWAEGGYIQIRTDPAVIERDAIGKWQLVPPSPPHR